jgi:hypothetical protein
MLADEHTHGFRTPAEEAFARANLARLADHGLTPEIVRWEPGAVVIRAGVWLPDWLTSATARMVAAMRPVALELVHGMHAQGVCHRDLHVENVVIVDGQPMAIDYEHACEVDPSWPCYDLTGPSDKVPLLPAHRQWGGVLGTFGIWWDAPLEPRFGGRYVPLGVVFGAADESP